MGAIWHDHGGVIDDFFADPCFVDTFAHSDNLATAITARNTRIIKIESRDASPDPEVHMIEC